MDQSIIKEAEQYATDKLSSELPDYAEYHDLEHTQTVVSEVRQLAAAEGVNREKMACLEIAAWFHDLGYLKKVDGHEELSAEMAEAFLAERNVSEEERGLIKRIILATEINHEPQDLYEKLIRDADLAHLGLKGNKNRSELLRQEKEQLVNRPIKQSAWDKMNIDFLEDAEYETESAQQKYGKRKGKFLKKLKKKRKKMIKKKGKRKKRGRGIETMFRVTLKNHMALSQIADNKANIMLSINAIIISIVLTSLLPKLDNNTYLIWPSVLLLAVCILAVIFATISTIPKVTDNIADLEKVKSRQINLLFFGNFKSLDLDTYMEGMVDVMNDEDYTYRSLVKDLYYLGKVLDKKYKYLRICYRVFMFGIILSVIAYLISLFLMFQPPSV
jgi:predicted metal-dependent HD superfamily phosphohydrolase